MAKMKVTRMRILAAVIAFVVFVWHAIMVDPTVANTDEFRPPPEGEAATIQKIKERALTKIRVASQPDGHWKRDAHPAPHGCVKAHFEVDNDLDEGLRYGVFSRPGHTFEAWIRFSNGLNADDNALDGRGMAIKLMGVPGDKLLEGEQKYYETQDFVMINHHTFPLSNVDEFLRFFEIQNQGDNLGYFIGWNPFEWRLREMRVGLGLLKRGASPLSMTYFSMLPYRLGPTHQIRYSAMSCDPDVTEECSEWEREVPSGRSAHYLREALIEDLTPSSDRIGPAARFAFRVQLRREGRNMPIEDASIVWSQDESPYQQVAEITIDAQRFDSEEQNTFCENLSFSPWHALPDHEPIGGLNRARKVLYDAISKQRHEKNAVARHEPRGFCLKLDGEPCENAVEQDSQ